MISEALKDGPSRSAAATLSGLQWLVHSPRGNNIKITYSNNSGSKDGSVGLLVHTWSWFPDVVS